MTISEAEYNLLSELITMPNRVLAQQIELLIFAKTRVPNEPLLEKFLEFLAQSDDASQFWADCEDYVKRINSVNWVVDDVFMVEANGVCYKGGRVSVAFKPNSGGLA